MDRIKKSMQPFFKKSMRGTGAACFELTENFYAFNTNSQKQIQSCIKTYFTSHNSCWVQCLRPRPYLLNLDLT